MSDYAIVADDVSKKFLLGRRSSSLKDRLTGFSQANREEFWAVRNVSVEVPRGSMLGVIGHNGSGKSTFLRTLCGVFRPTTGEIRVRGRVTALLELGAGFHPELTGRENIYMNGSVVGLDRAYMDSVMDEIIDMADIGSFIDAPIDTYSSGMRARLGFAVSVQMRPEILLADEITAVGDIAFKQHGIARMKELRDSGTTIVQVSHNLSMMVEACDQVLWLQHGVTRAIGPSAEIVAEYKRVAATEKAGRMIESPEPVPKVKARKNDRRERAAQATARLVERDVRPDALQTVVSAAPGEAPAVGGPMRVVLDLDVAALELDGPTAVEVRIDIVGARGANTGLGARHDVELLPPSGPMQIAWDLEELPLVSGRYNLAVGLWPDGSGPQNPTSQSRSSPSAMVLRHVEFVVEASADDRLVANLGGSWTVTTSVDEVSSQQAS